MTRPYLRRGYLTGRELDAVQAAAHKRPRARAVKRHTRLQRVVRTAAERLAYGTPAPWDEVARIERVSAWLAHERYVSGLVHGMRWERTGEIDRPEPRRAEWERREAVA